MRNDKMAHKSAIFLYLGTERKTMEKELNKYPFGRKPRPIAMLDMETGEKLQEFNSVSDAGRFIGVPNARAGITHCAKNETTSAYGYKWQYTD